MQLFIADHLMDVSDLSAEEHGAYCFILFSMWNAGGYLSNEPARLARVAHVELDHWKKVLAPRIMPFLTIKGGRVTQRRLLIEMAKMVAKQEAGSKGGRAKAARARSKPNSRARSKAGSK